MKIERITVAVTDMDAMVAFYNGVFDAGLQPVNTVGFHRGVLAGIPLLFCPNSIAEVNAEKNRQQFTIAVDDLNRFLDRVRASGGVVQSDAYETDTLRGVGVRDPDGNTIELVQYR